MTYESGAHVSVPPTSLGERLLPLRGHFGATVAGSWAETVVVELGRRR